MNQIEKIRHKYETGLPIFKRLFEMDSKSLKEKLHRICDSHPDKDVFEHGSVKKISVDDEPESIEIYYYSSFSISPMGIFYKPEHGPGNHVIEFNEFFKLE